MQVVLLNTTNKYLWYRRSLPGAAAAPAKGRWLLHFGAVDQSAAVYVNGKQVCRHMGGYLPFSTDITEVVSSRNTPAGDADIHIDIRAKEAEAAGASGKAGIPLRIPLTEMHSWTAL